MKLLSHLGSIEQIAKADRKELMKITGPRTAEAIALFFSNRTLSDNSGNRE